MLAAFITILAILSLGVMSVTVWQLRKTQALLKEIRRSQSSEPAIYEDLSRQVDEIQQTMGGVMNGLKAVGHQVYNLNILAGTALQHGAQAEPHGPLMIEVRRQEEGEPDGPEDLSPEMQQRIHTFQAIYETLVARQGHMPSRHQPEQN